MEKNCLHVDDIEKKNVCGDVYVKKKFAETCMLKKKCLQRRICLKKNVCGRTFLIHPLQKNNGPPL